MEVANYGYDSISWQLYRGTDTINGTITRDMFWMLAKFKYPTHQIAFCTEKSLEALTFKGSEELNDR